MPLRLTQELQRRNEKGLAQYKARNAEVAAEDEHQNALADNSVHGSLCRLGFMHSTSLLIIRRIQEDGVSFRLKER